MAPAVRVEQLGKRYRLGLTHTGSLRELVNQTAGRLFGRADRPAPTADTRTDDDGLFWALRDVSFDVASGEVVGIIGRNGAGKSTLLKILSRITPPTTGRVELFGRVASLLEVGTGFHPELTGRENIALNGTILGLTRREVAARLDEIVAFAEVDQFLDTPVKRYSSGMTVRLAFAVAAHLDPEVLIIDEVLAVGDAAFQRKCLSKMKDVAGHGRTVLFVSHNMVAVKSLCTRAVWLDQGRLLELGNVAEIAENYARRSIEAGSRYEWRAQASGQAGTRFLSVQLKSTETRVSLETPIHIACEIESSEAGGGLHINLQVFDESGACLFASDSPLFPGEQARVGADCTIPGNLLNDGPHHVSLLLVRDGGTLLDSIDRAICFEVVDGKRDHGWYGKWPGLVRPDLDWTLTKRSDFVACPPL